MLNYLLIKSCFLSLYHLPSVIYFLSPSFLVPKKILWCLSFTNADITEACLLCSLFAQIRYIIYFVFFYKCIIFGNFMYVQNIKSEPFVAGRRVPGEGLRHTFYHDHKYFLFSPFTFLREYVHVNNKAVFI